MKLFRYCLIGAIFFQGFVWISVGGATYSRIDRACSPVLNGGIYSPNGESTFNVFNFFAQGDDVSFWGDKNNPSKNRFDFQDGVNSPRVRFLLTGKKNDWFYRLSYDTAEVLIKSAFLRYEKFKYSYITLGQFPVPYNFWFLTTAPLNNFLERSLPSNAFTPGYRLGGQVQYFLRPFTLNFSLIAPDINNKILGLNIKGNTPFAKVSRITFAPIQTKQTVVHFAAAKIYQNSDSTGVFRFKSYPELQISRNQFLVDTGKIQNCLRFEGSELESAIILGSLMCEGEFYRNKVNRAQDKLYFNGLCVIGSYFLTGEHYVYDFKMGINQRISPILHSYGAWEINVRYSELDLQDKTVLGGREENLTFGLNWYASDFFLLAANYIIANLRPAADGSESHVNILGLRCQISA